MNCQKCGSEFQEKDIQESHDVPCYIFKGKDRKEKKKQADKYGRHNLCEKCHDIYEGLAFSIIVNHLTGEQRIEIIKDLQKFSTRYFNKEVDEDGNN